MKSPKATDLKNALFLPVGLGLLFAALLTGCGGGGGSGSDRSNEPPDETPTLPGDGEEPEDTTPPEKPDTDPD